MKLQVFHRTRYEYASPVRDSYNEARLQPISNEGQQCHRFLLKVLPSARLTHYTDFQQNTVHVFDIPEPHQALVVEAISVVTTSNATVLPADLGTDSIQRLPNSGQLGGCHDFLHASRYVDPDAEARRIALEMAADRDDIWHAAQQIMHTIHRDFAYTPAATTVHTHMREVLQLRRGVCQDLAHVMIGLCRALTIPARYVSGYLYNGPADQLRGAQASHAWVEIFLPNIGWRGLDPTNDGQPDERYVKLAAGRDYGDVSPVRGTYRGTPQRKMAVDVLVTSLE